MGNYRRDDVRFVRFKALQVFLNLRWLRPEAALWSAYEMPIVRDLLAGCPGPSLDFGCGDGTFSFLTANGEFNPSFDLYLSIDFSDTGTNVQNRDYYDSFQTWHSDDSSEFIKTDPSYRFSYGIDLKKNLILKAGQLRLYDNLIIHDASKPLDFIPDNHLRTVFSNILYWLPDIDLILKDLNRCLSKDGKLIVTCPNNSIEQIMLARYSQHKAMNWIEDIDMNRSKLFIHKYSAEKWIQCFNEAGFEVEQHVSYISDVVFRVYDIGLRPLFPALLHMYGLIRRELPADTFLEIKRYWIETCTHHLTPMLDESWMQNLGMNNHWHAFKLSKHS